MSPQEKRNPRVIWVSRLVRSHYWSEHYYFECVSQCVSSVDSWAVSVAATNQDKSLGPYISSTAIMTYWPHWIFVPFWWVFHLNQQAKSAQNSKMLETFICTLYTQMNENGERRKQIQQCNFTAKNYLRVYCTSEVWIVLHYCVCA